jgi:Transthyretin-like family
MTENEFTPGDVKVALDAFIDQSSDAAVPIMEGFAELQERRATRLADAEVRLKEGLGEDHPRVVALRQSAFAAEDLKRSLRTTAVRDGRLPKLGEHQWMVFGRVLDSGGRPVTGVRVRVFDRDRRYDDLLGETETDEYGDFSVVYHERVFAEAGEDLPELYVMVEDQQEHLLYSSRDELRYEAGRAEYFQIVLAQQQTEPSPE